jgi:sugar lactone lactonase YvrE
MKGTDMNSATCVSMHSRPCARRVLPAALLALTLGACGGGHGGGGGGSSTPPPPPPPSGTVAGVAGKGLLLNAIVNFYAVTNGAASTTSLASVRTNTTTGAFSSPVTSAGPVLVTVTVDSSSQMLDELSGTAVAAPAGLVLHALLDSVTNQQAIAVTPLTEMAYDIALAASGGLTAANNDAADNAVSTAFLNGAPVLDTQPIDIKNYKSAPVAQQELAKLLVALALAANEGTATGSSGAACTGGTYATRLVCMIGGLGTLLTMNSSGQGALAANANYIGAAYQQLSNGTVTVDGGQAPSALGLNVVTQAEQTFETALSTQAPPPGYNASAAPLANTKAFFADLRTNILAQSTAAVAQNFGLAPEAAAISADIKANVEPAFDQTVLAVSAMNIASELITEGLAGISVGSTAGIDGPEGIALGTDGTLYVADFTDDTVVQVNSSGVTSPFAGSTGVIGAANGQGPAASFDNPDSVAVDTAGNVYVADYDNNSIRMITPSGAVSTIAGGGNGPTPASTGTPPAGFLDGPGATALFSGPSGIVFDPITGNLFVADAINGAIRMISLPSYAVTTIAGGGGTQGAISYGTLGFKDGTGGSAGTALFFVPFGIAVDGSGNLYVADTFNHAIRKIAAGTYAVSTLAGGGGGNATNTEGTPGYANGSAAAALFKKPFQVAVDGSGNVFVADTGNAVIREISAGTVSLFAGTAPTAGPVSVVGNTDGAPGVATFGSPQDVIVTGSGAAETLYVADFQNAEIRKVDSSGNVTTFARSNRRYRAEKHTVICGYDPVTLATATNVALCRYGRSDNLMLMTVTQSSATTYDVKTQPLTGTPSGGPVENFLVGLTPSSAYAPLDASFSLVPSTNTVTGTVSGPYYVTATGGQVTGAITVAVSNLNGATGSGTIAASGTLSNGSGGISLTNATLGTDTTITLENDLGLGGEGFVAAGSPSPHGITATLDLSDVTTSAYSYAAKFTIGTGVADKSGTYDVPSSVTLTGSIAAVGTGGVLTPLFSGDVSLSAMGIASYDATQPISSTNFVTAEIQVAGDLSLSGGRVLTLSAALNASQTVPTPTMPDSLTVTYTYATPTGTRQVNATAQYDSVNGYSGTLTNNGGVKVTLTYPIGGGLSGTVTDDGTTTATITPTGTPGPTINYSDGTTESLF